MSATAPDAREHGRVVAGIDGSPSSEAAVRWAAVAAAGRGRRLHLVHAFTWPTIHPYFGGAVAEPYGEDVRQAAEMMVATAVEKVRGEHPDLDVSGDLVAGSPADALIEQSSSAVLIVVGSRGLGGFAGLLVGSVGTQLAAHSNCPVVVIPQADGESRDGSSAGHVVAGVDLREVADGPAEAPDRFGRAADDTSGTGEVDAVLEFAFTEAAHRKAPLTALHAWTVPPDAGFGAAVPRAYDVDKIVAEETHRVDEQLAAWRERFPTVEVRPLVRHAAAANALITESAGAELVVVGSPGHGALRGLFLGSVSNAVLHHAGCPVAIVPIRHGRG